MLLLTGLALAQAPLYGPEVGDEGLVGVNVEETNAQGAIVADLVAGSPAAQAGMRAGDLVTSIGGTSVVGMSAIQALSVCRRNQGSRATFEVLRGAEKLSFELTWAPIPAEILASMQAQVQKKQRQTVRGWVEKMEGRRLGIILDAPVARVIPVGAPVLLPGEESAQVKVLRSGQVTRAASHFRLEAELPVPEVCEPEPAPEGAETPSPRLWDRAFVVL